MGTWGKEGCLAPGPDTVLEPSLTRHLGLSGGCLLSPRHRWRQACGVRGLPAWPSRCGHGLTDPLPHG